MKITNAHKLSMGAVRDGADISSPIIARHLRQIEKHHPDLIDICKPMGQYNGAGHVPYFGAILTERGSRFLDGEVVV